VSQRREARIGRLRAAATVLVALAAALAIAACGGSDDEDGGSGSASTTTGPAKGEPIVIGAAIAETGFFNVADKPATVMMQFGIDDFNQKGGAAGRPYKLEYADTKSDPNQGTNAALKLIDEGADIIWPSVDYDFGRAAASTGSSRGKLVIGAAGSPKFGVQGIGPLVYNVGISSNTEGATMAEYAYQDLKFRTAYVLLDDTIDYTKQACAAFETRWKELAGNDAIVGKDTFKNGDASIASQITRMKGVSPEPAFIALCSYNPGAASAIRQTRAAGVDTPIVASASMDGKFWLEAIPNLSDFYYTAYASLFGDDPDPTVNQLVKRYTAKTGEFPTQSTSVVGYRAIQVLTKGIGEAGSVEGAQVANKLNALSAFPTLIGPITFTPEDHLQLKNPLRIIRIDNGKQTFVKLWDPESVPPFQF
jgi:branched-chain amino acid transport system substrate-binding protein